jgi:RecA-family ATPase
MSNIPCKSEPLKFTFTHADDLSNEEGAYDFVENVLTDGAVSVVYGASNSGKTFFALDLAAHIATGKKWQDKEVERGAVLYIALEGTQGAVNRIKAMKMRGILPEGAPLYVCFSPVNLLDPMHPAAITRLIQSVTSKARLPVRFVIIDTMARAMAGGDENSGQDMGTAVKTIEAVREETGAHICLIHHSGKDAAKGARGHSSLRAAIDTEIEVVHPEGGKYRTATIVKQRDLEKITPLCFSLEAIEVGTNRRGKPITSCVVKAEDGMMAHTKGKPGAKKKFTCDMVLELLPQPSVAA